MKSYLVTFGYSRISGRVILSGYVELSAENRDDAVKKALAKGYVPHPDEKDIIQVWELAK